MEQTIDDKNEIIMKMLHYFIIEKNYNPIILQGAENEIWLENLESNDYKIVRIVSNRIINEEQLSFDLIKTKQVISQIKKKTLSFNMPVLSIFTDLDNKVPITSNRKLAITNVSDELDLEKSELIKKTFPDMLKKLKFSEEGVQLFMKITSDINNKNKKEAEQVNKVFKKEEPVVTKFLVLINVLLFLVLLFSGEPMSTRFGVNNEHVIMGKEYYRLFSAIFAHADFIHLGVNMYALYIIGSQIENFLGKTRYLAVYLFSGILGSLFSIALNDPNVISVGASGAIFGLMGSLLYFGYHYRIYLSVALKNQIIPILLINLALGFVIPGIDNFAHIGGLIGGVTATMAVGLKYKTSTIERINGLVISIILLAFMVFLAANKVI